MQADKDSYVRMSYSDEEPAPAEAKLREHWTRSLATEFFGSFVCNVVMCGVIHTVYFSDIDAITKIHDRGIFGPTNIFSFPLPMLLLAVGIGLAYCVGLMVAPEATLNPAFTFAMVLGGVRPMKVFIPSVIGQFFGKLFGGLTVYAAAHQYFLSTAGITCENTALDGCVYYKSTDMMGTNYASLYGFAPPHEKISNAMCCWNSMIFTALLICVVIPAALKSPGQMHVVVGLTVAAFACATPTLGVINDPISSIAGALICTIAGFEADKIWKIHHGFLWAATMGPILGVILGVSVFRLYASLVWETPKR